MIDIYTGTPGSGKSLDCAGVIRNTLNKPRGIDRPVIANFDVNLTNVKRPQAFHYIPNDELTPELLTSFADDFWTHADRRFSEDYIILALDECQLVWNSRSWMDRGRAGKKDSRMDWLEFFSQHRKYGYYVILIAQSSKMIDNQFRMLIDNEINHRKVQNMGMVGNVIGTMCFGRLFLRVKYLFQTRERLGMSLMWAKEKDMAMYDSYARLKQVKQPTK